MGELVKAYKALWLNRVNIDVIPPEAPFDRYKIIVAPFLYLVNRDLVDKLRDFVYRGGTLVLTPRSFIKDEYNRVNIDLDKVYELTGVKIEEYTRLPQNTKAILNFRDDNPLLRRNLRRSMARGIRNNNCSTYSLCNMEMDKIETCNNYE
jgi:beta-galactosidase